MKYISTFFLFLGLWVTADGQSALLIGRSNVNFDFFTGTANGGDSSVISYNSAHLPIQYKNWKLENTGNWLVKSRSTDYSYDAAGNILFYQIQTGDDVNGWNDQNRYTYTYSLDGQELSYLHEKWNGTNWVAQLSSYLNEYDANGNLLSKTRSNYRTLNTYDVQGRLETRLEQTTLMGNWVNSSLTNYTYLALDTNIETETSFTWLNNSWAENNRYFYAYSATGKISETLSQKWIGAGWENNILDANTYDTNDNLVLHMFQQWTGQAWENNNQTSFTYDAAQNLTFWVTKKWIAGDWQFSWQQENSFDAKNNFITARSEFWNGSAWLLVGFGRNTYMEVVHTYMADLVDFEVFPNPASTSITLKGLGLSSVLIFDQQGRLVRSDKLLSQETLPLGNLAAGHYLIKVLTHDGKSGVKPLIIRH